MFYNCYGCRCRRCSLMLPLMRLVVVVVVAYIYIFGISSDHLELRVIFQFNHYSVMALDVFQTLVWQTPSPLHHCYAAIRFAISSSRFRPFECVWIVTANVRTSPIHIYSNSKPINAPKFNPKRNKQKNHITTPTCSTISFNCITATPTKRDGANT